MTNFPYYDPKREYASRLRREGMLVDPDSSMATPFSVLLSKLESYCLHWRDLGNIKPFVTRANGTDNPTAWLDGKHDTGDSFMGESGGCIYHAEVECDPSTGMSNIWGIEIFQPPSIRMERTGLTIPLKCGGIEFLKGVAIDLSRKTVVLLSKSPTGWCSLHVWDLARNARQGTAFRWETSWEKDDRVTQMEVSWPFVAVSVRPLLRTRKLSIAEALQVVNMEKRSLVWVSLRPQMIFRSFQFIQDTVLLIAEEARGPIDPAVGFRIRDIFFRLVSLTQESPNRLIRFHDNTVRWFNNELRPRQYSRDRPSDPDYEDDVYLTFLSNAALSTDGPFHTDPASHLVGIKIQRPHSNYDDPDVVLLFEKSSILNPTARSVVGTQGPRGFQHGLNGRKIVWFDPRDNRVHAKDTLCKCLPSCPIPGWRSTMD